MKIIILAAGRGGRLGDPKQPKPLTLLSNGKSILQLQLDILSLFFSLHQVIIVVGFHKEKIMEQFPNLLFVYNPNYAKENTAKSLLRAVEKIDEEFLWVNGDLIFHPTVLEKLIAKNRSSAVVNTMSVGDEEVKYRTDTQGKIVEISKEVKNPQGESLGFNFCHLSDVTLFKDKLKACEQHDYFEKALEKAILEGMQMWPVVVDASLCAEIDFPEDLQHANELISGWD